ncbi:hypothetical protein OG930_03125 [Streptomyces sp. NBC_01799]|uniref:hypothetical protein n=1 Tax=Streptomyces sp. NBC_01800 TaxID=2975945 RepID=UPI002DD93348|nr:hypothetical protein [Streptomyces sp. NBC_01800]WSA66087.1 hypothetical protein OIE65_03200 [Streptomyces sp. NBC_01800]WSA74688.1 hypothetical protein OG930_03125 [Streptomyces sp. NBC_01799]
MPQIITLAATSSSWWSAQGHVTSVQESGAPPRTNQDSTAPTENRVATVSEDHPNPDLMH